MYKYIQIVHTFTTVYTEQYFVIDRQCLYVLVIFYVLSHYTG